MSCFVVRVFKVASKTKYLEYRLVLTTVGTCGVGCVWWDGSEVSSIKLYTHHSLLQ